MTLEDAATALGESVWVDLPDDGSKVFGAFVLEPEVITQQGFRGLRERVVFPFCTEDGLRLFGPRQSESRRLVKKWKDLTGTPIVITRIGAAGSLVVTHRWKRTESSEKLDASIAECTSETLLSVLEAARGVGTVAPSGDSEIPF